MFPERLHCEWCATNGPAASCYWVVPIRDVPGTQSSSLAFWNSKNKVVTHHLPPSAAKTREHAVQASCWISMCDPFWRIIPSFFCWKNISTHFTSMTNKPLPMCSEMSHFPVAAMVKLAAVQKRNKTPKHLMLLWVADRDHKMAHCTAARLLEAHRNRQDVPPHENCS